MVCFYGIAIFSFTEKQSNLFWARCLFTANILRDNLDTALSFSILIYCKRKIQIIYTLYSNTTSPLHLCIGSSGADSRMWTSNLSFPQTAALSLNCVIGYCTTFTKDYTEDKIWHLGKLPCSGRHVLLLVEMLIITFIHEGTICLSSIWNYF